MRDHAVAMRTAFEWYANRGASADYHALNVAIVAAADHIASLEARVAELEKIVRGVAEYGCHETIGDGDGCGQCIACRSLKLLNYLATPDSSPCVACGGSGGWHMRSTGCPACHGSGKEGE